MFGVYFVVGFHTIVLGGAVYIYLCHDRLVCLFGCVRYCVVGVYVWYCAVF